jgi:wyosine [tRNA(Phe)-imidazoG37] synthetase (radical SAM superfamily)
MTDMTAKVAGKANGNPVYSFKNPHQRRKNTVYINMVGKYKCTNNCLFCGRNAAITGKPTIYETNAGTSLYLSELPKTEDIITAVMPKLKKPFFRLLDPRNEVVIVGLGEPLLNFRPVCDVIAALRAKGYHGPIGLDTNGLIKRIDSCNGREAKTNHALLLKQAGLTNIRISVNATTSVEYDELCKPLPLYARAYVELCRFVEECMVARLKTMISFVVGFRNFSIATRDASEYISFAKCRFGLGPENVLLRNYVPVAVEGANTKQPQPESQTV